MLNQVFESVPGTLAIHEPYSPQNLYYLLEYGKLNITEYEVLPKSLIRDLCKPRPEVTKFSSHEESALQWLRIFLKYAHV